MEQANCQITGVSFRLFAENESKRLSSLSIVNPTTFDPLGHPIDTGLADTALGPLKRNDFCKTCGLTDSHCLGHFGHISLPLPVFNPFLMKQLYQVLRMFCFNCHHFLFSRNLVEVYIAQLRALNLGLDFMLEDIVNEGHALTSGGKVVDWNSLEGQTYVRGKLNELINKVYSEQQQLSGQSVAPSCFAGPSKQNNISSRDSVKSEMFDDTEIRPVRDPTVNGSIATSTPSASKTHVAHVESVDIMNSKNVIEKKQHLFKDFIGGKLVKPAKVCTYCHARKAGMNVINRSLIILSASKAAQSVAKFVANDEEGDDNDRQNASTINIEMKGKSYLTPSQAREHLRLLWGNESDTLLRIFPFINFDVDEQQGLPGVQLDFDNQSLPDAHQSPCPLDVFFWETILVSPNRFRPLRFLNGRSFEHYRTSALSELMIVAKSLEYALETAKKNASGSKNGDSIARFHSQWQRLQILCNRLYDAKMDNLPDNKAIGVKQILEKKEGLLRKNMMGKRVNFAARSVISPDPYIMADEIGVPVIFATRLSYPQPVTNWNVKQLQEMVINGPNVHPGALSVMYEDGFTVRLKPEDIGQRRSVAATLHAPTLSQGMNGVKIVNRHLISGDVLLLNRQPTLHKPSIMAHKARVLPREKTLRLHYANCKCYNADFDGDEMNAHFPQSELARAEAYGIASVNYQFLVPKDGSPLSGLIQDHIVAGVMMTVRGKFFNKSDYQELVYGALSFLDRRIKFLPPTILKPEQLWSGKQIISTLVINLVPKGKPLPSFDIESKVSPKMLLSEKTKDWKYGGSPLKDKEMCESQVVFRRGELLCGLMDKVNFGANKNGLIHCCYELYGGDIHTKLLTAIARVSTNYLQSHHGFTLGIHDILVRSKPNVKRRKLIDMAGSLGQQAVADAFGMKSAFEDGTLTHEAVEEKLSFAHTSKDDFYMKQLDAAYKSYTDNLSNQISSTCLPKGLVKTFPSNNLQMMIQTGAKGGSVNAIQISALLGQIELEGRRIPLMMSGRTLPSFQPYETHPRAGGFVTGRFLTGIRPQEFFFHCMAGREGLIDTAVKTSRSGYLQRCLIKHLEGLVVNYDLTVRDSEGSVVQWMYGEDGLDVTRSQSLNKSFFPTIMKNRDALKPTKDELERLKAARDPTVTKQVVTVRKSLEAEKKHKPEKSASNTRESPFLRFESELKEKSMSMDAMPKKQIVDSWFALQQKEKYSFYQQLPKAADPVISRYRPDLNFGAISETLDSVILNYCDSELATLSRSTRKEDKKTLKEFKNTLNVCYMRALCAPGEAVGLLAAQSIGEPSTQMTLNTFHFAGRGEMNVTLGVPRLRELLMTASPNISTPSMDIPFRTDLPPELAENVESEAEKIRLRLNAVRLKDVLEYVDVVEMLEIYDTDAHHRYRNYNLRFQFLPRSSYKRRCFTKPAKVLHFMETQFIKQFIDAMNRRFRLLTKSSGLFDTKSLSSRARTASTRKKTAAGDGADEEELMMQEADGDAGADDYLDPEEKKRVSMDNIDDEDEDEDAEDLDLDEGEGDTTAMKHRTRLNQEREYEEADQEEMEDDESDNEQLEDDGTVPIGGVKEEEDDVTVTMINQKNNSKLISGVQLEGVHAERRTRVLNNGRGIVMDYTFDTEKELWCEVTLRFELIAAKLDLRSIVMEEAGKAFVHRVGRMDRVFLVKDNEAAKRGAAFAQLIKTEGVSLAHVVEFERMLDLRRIYTNDMHAIANTYGIEAARAALIREISNVFAVYGISVDGRHLSLIADHMTFTGSIKGMNRGAMDGISPLQAMTFETTTSFLKNSLLLDLKDDLHSPSSRLVIGRPTLVGSGLFETRLNPMLLTGLQSPNVTFGTSVLHRSSMGGFGTPMVGPSGLSARPTPHTVRRTNQHRILNDTFLTPSMIAPSLLAGRKAATTAGKATKRSAAKMESQPSQEAIVNGSAVKNGATAAGGEATSSRKATPNSSVTAPTPLAKRIKFEYDTE